MYCEKEKAYDNHGLFGNLFKANIYDVMIPPIVKQYDKQLYEKYDNNLRNPVSEIVESLFGDELSDQTILWMALGAGSVILVILWKWMR